MCLKTEDMAKIAQLYLQNGQWEGQQLVPEDWIRDATTPHIIQADGWYPTINAGMEDYFSGYGYQIWMNSVPTGYRFDGMYAQLGVVLPKYDMVVVTTAATCRIYKVLTTLWRILIPALENQALPEDSAAWDALKEKLSSLQIPWGTGDIHSALEEEISGHPIVLPRNRYSLLPERVRLFGGRKIRDPEDAGLKSMTLSFQKEGCTLSFQEWGSETVLPLGFGEERREGEVELVNLERKVLGSYSWETPDTLRIDLLHIHSVYHRIIRLTFQPMGKVDVSFTELPNDIDAAVNMDYVPGKCFACDLY